ncbi:MAG: response regulator transcription factor [Candidatus Aenigmarchaeota archaeon]|nr:response regulator transcription factor [Candidatus Aenigmarchaeota archaeon]
MVDPQCSAADSCGSLSHSPRKAGRKPKLLGKEKDVLYFYSLGLSVRMIASELCVSRSSVHRFLQKFKRKEVNK